MDKNKFIIPMLLSSVLALAGCASGSNTSNTTQTNTKDKTEETTADSSSTSNSSSSTSASDDSTQDDVFEIDGTTVKAGDISLSDYSDPVKIMSSGTYILSGETDQMVIVDAPKQDVTIVLKDVTINNQTGPCIYVKKASNVTFEIHGINTLTSGSSYTYETLDGCIYSKADVIFEGDGTLNIQAGYEHGIKAKDTAQFKGGNYVIDAQNDGIHVNETADFTGGSYDIYCNGEGIESKDILTISDGDYIIDAYDDGINAINGMELSGGNIYVVSQNNDGIDANGYMRFSGANITAIGIKTPEMAFDVDNTEFSITGGSIIGAGSSVTYPTSASQPVIMLSVSGSVSSVEIQKDGSSIASWSFNTPVTSNGGALTLSDPDLQLNETYTILVNGSEYQTVTLSDTTTTIGNIQTMGGPGGMGGPGNQQGGPGNRR